MSAESNGVPGAFRLAWMLLAHPEELRARLSECGLANPTRGFVACWLRPGPNPTAERRYAWRMLLVALGLGVGSWLIALSAETLEYGRLPHASFLAPLGIIALLLSFVSAWNLLQGVLAGVVMVSAMPLFSSLGQVSTVVYWAAIYGGWPHLPFTPWGVDTAGPESPFFLLVAAASNTSDWVIVALGAAWLQTAGRSVARFLWPRDRRLGTLLLGQLVFSGSIVLSVLSWMAIVRLGGALGPDGLWAFVLLGAALLACQYAGFALGEVLDRMLSFAGLPLSQLGTALTGLLELSRRTPLARRLQSSPAPRARPGGLSADRDPAAAGQVPAFPAASSPLSTREPAGFPGFLQLVWLFFMRPGTLRRRLHDCGVDNLALGAWRLLTVRDDSSRVRGASIALLVVMAASVALGVWTLSTGPSPDWGQWAHLKGTWFPWLGTGVALGFDLSCGCWMLLVVLASYAAGDLGSLLAAWPELARFDGQVLAGLGAGLFLGAITPSMCELRFGRRWTKALYLTLIFGTALGLILAPPGRLAAFIWAGFLLGATRLPVWPLEALWQTGMYWLEVWFGLRTLRFCPVLAHELSLLQDPYLEDHLCRNWQAHPDLVGRVLESCKASMGQQEAGRRALASIQLMELEHLVRQHRFDDVARLEGTWLPGVSGADASLLALSGPARAVTAAMMGRRSVSRLAVLQRASERLAEMVTVLSGTEGSHALLVARAVTAFQEVIEEVRESLAKQPVPELPNPFIAGEPLTSEKGGELFRGRGPLLKTLGSLLASDAPGPCLALVGPRRCGKTSVLKMLPSLSPEVVPIFFDLQDNPIDCPADFFQRLAARAREQAMWHRRLELPPFDAGAGFEGAWSWLKELELSPDPRPVLIAIDEYERLESLFPGGRGELLEVGRILRNVVANFRKVRLLVAGAAPLEESPGFWQELFPSPRVLRVEHFDRPTVRELLGKPTEDFPPFAIPVAVADAVFERTGGQPFLVQLYGSLLCQTLEDYGRRQARAADLAVVEDQVLVQASYYFRHTYLAAPEETQQVLRGLAVGDRRLDVAEPHAWLRNRCLVSPGGELAIPVLGRWILEESAG